MSRTILFIAFVVFLQGALGELVCEELPVEMCSFAVASSGKRCLLETFKYSNSGSREFLCKTSEVIAMNMLSGYIESEECMSACGVDRHSIGISSDYLLEAELTLKLCSKQCYDNCPNILDLYYNLAFAEGIHLPELCKSQRTGSPRRSAIQLISSSAAAAYATNSSEAAYAPYSSEALPLYDLAPSLM